MKATESSLRIETIKDLGVDDGLIAGLRLSGNLALEDADRLMHGVRAAVPDRTRRVQVDLSRVARMDGASAAVLLCLANEQARAGGALEFTGATAPVQRILDVYAASESGRGLEEKVVHRDFVEEVGYATAQRWQDAKSVFAFAGQLMVSLGGAIRRPKSVHWRELGLLMERAGADSLPIVVVINFLVGLIMGYQAAIQLTRFGGNIFIADLVGLTMTRELGPLMTAIIVAGRSGAAYAAELGTMQVRQEIDALSTLSLDPARFLVFPRIFALAAMMPLLTLLADLVGCLGGLVVGMVQLNLTMSSYLNELQLHLHLWDVFGGVIKSVFFAVTIALISCERGIATRGGADAVGNSTTSAVVIILFALVAEDAVFSVVYNWLDI